MKLLMIAYTYIHFIKILFCLSLYGLLVTFFQALCSCNSSQSLPLKIETPELIIKRGNFFNTQKEYAVILREDNKGEAFIKDLDNPLYTLEVLVQNNNIDTVFSLKGLPISSTSINYEIIDYNFDGKNDIAVTLYTSARGNNRKSIFLYNQIDKSFDYVTNSHLLHSLSVDDSLQLIKSCFEEFSDEIGAYYHREYYYQYDGFALKKAPLNLEYHNQISILPTERVNQFAEHGDTFHIGVIKAYELLNEQEKVQELLADTQHYQRKLLIGGYPNHKKKSFSIEVREFVDARASIIASFSVNAYTGDIFFEPKPFSKAYENGLWKIPIDEWDSKLE
jgi:hypothetical protein